jgi:hypothetical protein
MTADILQHFETGSPTQMDGAQAALDIAAAYYDSDAIPPRALEPETTSPPGQAAETLEADPAVDLAGVEAAEAVDDPDEAAGGLLPMPQEHHRLGGIAARQVAAPAADSETVAAGVRDVSSTELPQATVAETTQAPDIRPSSTPIVTAGGREENEPLEALPEAGVAIADAPAEPLEAEAASGASGGDSGNGSDDIPTSRDPEEPEPDPKEERREYRALEQRARREAELFELPTTVTDRPVVKGVAIDHSASTTLAEDTVGLPETLPDGGGSQFTISTIDPSALAKMPAVLKRAQRIGETVYNGKRNGNMPMLPDRIGRKVLGLREHHTSPVIAQTNTFSDRGVDRGEPFLGQTEPLRITYAQANLLLGDPNSNPLIELDRLANILDQGKDLLPMWRKDFGYTMGPEGRLVPMAAGLIESPSEHMVNALIRSLNEGMGEWAYDNDVPVLYFNQALTGSITIEEVQAVMQEGTLEEQQIILAHLRASIKPPELGTIPTGHALADADIFMRASSPLRRFDSLVNTMNIGARLAGEEYPFPAAVLPGIIQHLGNRALLRQYQSVARQEVARDFLEFATSHTLIDLGRDQFRWTVQALSEDSPPSLRMAYVTAIQRRLNRGFMSEVELSDYLKIIASHESIEEQDPGWTTLGNTLTEYAEANPSIAVDVISRLAHMAGTPHNIVVSDAGPPYRAFGDYTLEDNTHYHVKITDAPTKAAARDWAAIELVRALATPRQRVVAQEDDASDLPPSV